MANVIKSQSIYTNYPLGSSPVPNDAIPIALDGGTHITFGIDYTAGAVGGAVTAIVQFSMDGEKWWTATDSEKAAPIVVGSSVYVNYQVALLRYGDNGIPINPLTATFTVLAKYARLVVWETGVPLTPGIVNDAVYFLSSNLP